MKGLLDEENCSMLSVKYRTEQQQLDETIKIVSARHEEAKAETNDVKRWVDLIQKQVWDIEIYYRFVGKID